MVGPLGVSREEFNEQRDTVQRTLSLLDALSLHGQYLEAQLLQAKKDTEQQLLQAKKDSEQQILRAKQDSEQQILRAKKDLEAVTENFIGCIGYFPMSSPPDGWLECYGQTISRDKYSKLFVKIGTTFGAGDGQSTFTLPDLRGQFIRGWDHSGTKDEKNRALGSIQSDQIKTHGHNDAGHTHDSEPHQHSLTTDSAGDHKYLYPEPNGSIGSYYSTTQCCHFFNTTSYCGNHSHSGNTDSIATTINAANSNITEPTQASHGAETRPKNIALLACIKYA